MVKFKKEIVSPEWDKNQFFGEQQKKITFVENLTLQQYCIHKVLLYISKKRKDFEIVFFNIHSISLPWNYKLSHLSSQHQCMGRDRNSCAHLKRKKII